MRTGQHDSWRTGVAGVALSPVNYSETPPYKVAGGGLRRRADRQAPRLDPTASGGPTSDLTLQAGSNGRRMRGTEAEMGVRAGATWVDGWMAERHTDSHASVLAKVGAETPWVAVAERARAVKKSERSCC